MWKNKVAVFLKWSLWEVAPRVFSGDEKFLDVFGSLYVPELLRLVLVVTCSGILMFVNGIESVGRVFSLTSVGSVLSVVLVSLISGSEITEVV